MDYSKLQLEAVAYIFEKANGNSHSAYEDNLMIESGLTHVDVTTLEKTLIDGLDSGVYEADNLCTDAYWALSKRFNKELIPCFQQWLALELNMHDTNAVFQIMIALDNLAEPVFDKNKRQGFAANEIEMNLQDAEDYLARK